MSYEILKKSGTLVEHWKYQYAPIVFKSRKRKDPSRKGNRKHFTRRADNVRRSVSLFRRLVRSNLVRDENPTLLTVTMLQVFSLKTSFRIFTGFAVRLRTVYGKDFRYIAVPEFQKRGAVHFHVLVWGIKKEVLEEETTTRRIQRLWAHGFVDFIVTDGSPKLAAYLSKYLSKAMQDVRLGGERAYSCSRNVLRPVRVATKAFGDDVLDQWGVDRSKPEYVHKFNVRFLGECTYQAYTKDE